MLHFAVIMEREYFPNQAASQLKQAFVIKRKVSRKSYCQRCVAAFPPPAQPHRGPCPRLGFGCAPPAPGLASLRALPVLPFHLSQTDLEKNPTHFPLSASTGKFAGRAQHVAGAAGAAGTAVCCCGGLEHADERCSGHKSSRSQLGEDENRFCSCTGSGGPGSPSETCKETGSSLAS